ncbi:uncharacterized protein ATNIH1004_001965 [Aspergillus tanneri]|uniref:Uncharacterized protein n=1 Tax=Aspergillus tanneri TaxID=1220188 RepID=A0A5M9M8W2_9EURO|nr:uncharacterized protein ATNIH1004_001965 [Aspergillus tanneri]KAA8641363.1 hypothetical protein ATNIH1004_001965 [Aspergillus tanneri]
MRLLLPWALDKAAEVCQAAAIFAPQYGAPAAVNQDDDHARLALIYPRLQNTQNDLERKVNAQPGKNLAAVKRIQPEVWLFMGKFSTTGPCRRSSLSSAFHITLGLFWCRYGTCGTRVPGERPKHANVDQLAAGNSNAPLAGSSPVAESFLGPEGHPRAHAVDTVLTPQDRQPRRNKDRRGTIGRFAAGRFSKTSVFAPLHASAWKPALTRWNSLHRLLCHSPTPATARVEEMPDFQESRDHPLKSATLVTSKGYSANLSAALLNRLTSPSSIRTAPSNKSGIHEELWKYWRNYTVRAFQALLRD